MFDYGTCICTCTVWSKIDNTCGIYTSTTVTKCHFMYPACTAIFYTFCRQTNVFCGIALRLSTSTSHFQGQVLICPCIYIDVRLFYMSFCFPTCIYRDKSVVDFLGVQYFLLLYLAVFGSSNSSLLSLLLLLHFSLGSVIVSVVPVTVNSGGSV